MSHPAPLGLRATGLPAFAALAVLLGPAAHAQGVLVPVDSTSQEIVQPLPPQATADLNAALKRLAIDPNDADALLAAGNASLKLHDVDAATGFYTRAQAVGSNDGAAKAGLAAADVYKKKPVEALRLFSEAQAEGASLTDHVSDYGLAFDLVGDNARAQDLYRKALGQGPDDETTRRLALSEAIGGDQTSSERTLLPLLQHRDLAAYRTRAFALAALGKTDEAVSIAEAIMPASLAGRIAPYLRYMPKLTRAQQAAAANFGHFPEAGAIGVDDPRIAEYARAAQLPPAVQASDQRLVPAGAPLGQADKPAPPPAQAIGMVAGANSPPQGARASSRHIESTANFALGPGKAPTSAPGPAATETSGELPPLAQQTTLAPSNVPSNGLPPLSGSTASRTVEEQAPPPAAPPPERTGPIARPTLSVLHEPSQEPEKAKPDQPSVEDAFAEFSTVKTKPGPKPGAVDVTEIQPPRAAAPKAEPPKPKNPSRIWVQVATGKDRKALGFDWRRISGKASRQFRGKDGYLVKWGRTNRLVTGPFDSEREAQAFVDELRRAGVKTFVFTSKQGEAVAPL